MIAAAAEEPPVVLSAEAIAERVETLADRIAPAIGEDTVAVALLTGGPRNATIVAARSCTLLSLDIADFRQLLARQPDLARVIHEEAQRRPGGAPHGTGRRIGRRAAPIG